jgi:hypothetical protein
MTKNLRRFLMVGALVVLFSGPLGGVANADFSWESVPNSATADAHSVDTAPAELSTLSDFSWE